MDLHMRYYFTQRGNMKLKMLVLYSTVSQSVYDKAKILINLISKFSESRDNCTEVFKYLCYFEVAEFFGYNLIDNIFSVNTSDKEENGSTRGGNLGHQSLVQLLNSGGLESFELQTSCYEAFSFNYVNTELKNSTISQPASRHSERVQSSPVGFVVDVFYYAIIAETSEYFGTIIGLEGIVSLLQVS
ncbi:uncharacterized protein Gasu_24610 [Galdieria sulphuraria]|uniref:Uncharacterized protein n=1 Tax=Galdieria sulphuraria TaxID=130081 RepID=M2XJM4_GALSU|nr:uncharacterized protein Gasu_24610 [Galdieria sulphuraria]EME30317.1 hypothetical protein Gasu_24610 [Galdieria sulphuraria]|eukprot:XP_005706837.1 hypothetical protein Gasu_24610 [Galdieria sulphuraria]